LIPSFNQIYVESWQFPAKAKAPSHATGPGEWLIQEQQADEL
jgi:hypothetical protein